VRAGYYLAVPFGWDLARLIATAPSNRGCDHYASKRANRAQSSHSFLWLGQLGLASATRVLFVSVKVW
jgi:hypothetical protein